MALIVIGVVVLLALAAVVLMGTARRRAGTGQLSRETRRADASAPPAAAVPDTVESATPVPVGDNAPVRYEPVDEDELGVTRRQFFNRGILTGLSLAVAGFGGAALAFLWPSGAGGTSGKINVGSVDDVVVAAETEDGLGAGAELDHQAAHVAGLPDGKGEVGGAEETFDGADAGFPRPGARGDRGELDEI